VDFGRYYASLREAVLPGGLLSLSTFAYSRHTLPRPRGRAGLFRLVPAV
jgi:hypothetical protein